MKHLILVILLLATQYATAGGKPHGSSHSNSNSISLSKSASHSKSAAASASHAQATGVGQGGAATSLSSSQGGTATATGGSVSDVANQSAGDVSIVGDRSPRQAPSVALVAPQSTMDCAKGFGWGGSNKTGSVILGLSWLQRDCYSMLQFTTLANLGLPEAAAGAFCARPLHWRPFETKDNCLSLVTQSLISLQLDRAEVAATKKLPRTSALHSVMPKRAR